MSILTGTIQFRGGTAAEWTAANPVLLEKELGYETDTGKAKIGNGTSAWSSLTYATWGIAGASTDWGDIGGTLSDQTDLNNALVALDTEIGTVSAAAMYKPVTQGVQDNIVVFDRDGNAGDSGSAITLVLGAAQKSANLSDLTNASVARSNIDAQQTLAVTAITPAIDDTFRARDTSNSNADITFSIRDMFLERGEVRMRYGFEFFTDFINLVSTTGTDGSLAATNSGTGAAVTQQGSDTQNIVGVARSSTGTTATGRSAISTSTNIIRLGGGVWFFEKYVNITTLSTITERFQNAIGFIDTLTAANQVDGVYFLYDEGGVSTGSAASPNWQIVTASNSTRTFTTTATAVAAATWVRLTIIINAAGTSVTFYINGTSVGTHATTIPTASGRAVGIGALLIKSIGTTARTVDYDYAVALADYTTPKT